MINIHNNLTWYNPISWIKTGFKIKTKVLHAQWWSWFLAPVYLTILSIAKLRKKKIIMTIHNVKPHEKSFIKNWLNKSVIGLADEYIVHSEDNKIKFKQYSKNKTISVIQMGLDIKETINKDKAKQQLKLSEKSHIILFFGNIRDYKGLDILIKALAVIKSKKDIMLLIAGQIWDKKLISQIKRRKNIIYSGGFIPENKVVVYFSASDLVVYPYKYFDASSAAGAEALAFGKPVVVTSVGGLPELVKDKKVIAEPNSPEDLARKIIYALKNLDKLEKDSKELAKQFSWEKIAEEYKGVYE